MRVKCVECGYVHHISDKAATKKKETAVITVNNGQASTKKYEQHVRAQCPAERDNCESGDHTKHVVL